MSHTITECVLDGAGWVGSLRRPRSLKGLCDEEYSTPPLQSQQPNLNWECRRPGQSTITQDLGVLTLGSMHRAGFQVKAQSPKGLGVLTPEYNAHTNNSREGWQEVVQRHPHAPRVRSVGSETAPVASGRLNPGREGRSTWEIG